MKSLAFLACFTVFVLCSPSSVSAASGNSRVASSERDTLEVMAVASYEQQKLQLVTKRLASIRSIANLHAYLARTPRGPLDNLSPWGRKVFLSSLKFNEQGLTQFDFTVVEEELSATEAYRLLGLFGVQRTTSLLKGLSVETGLDKLIMSQQPQQRLYMADHKGYFCKDQGTCQTSPNSICLDGC